MLLATEEEVCILWNMFCEIKSIGFKVKILAELLKQAFETVLKLVLVEKDWHLLYLLYQLTNYHPQKLFDMYLMCPIIV